VPKLQEKIYPVPSISLLSAYADGREFPTFVSGRSGRNRDAGDFAGRTRGASRSLRLPNGKIVLLGYPDRNVNHSCNPTAYVLYEGDRSFLVARRDIVAGEEITCDYNINITGGTAWPCHCGAARCGGTTVGDFFLLPLDIQREYRPMLADWFVRAHGDRLRALGLT
jgi:hypothetical protein